MKKLLFIFLVLICILTSAQKKYKNILNSTDIPEIESFLKDVHPDDSRRVIMKRKLISLKNDKWMNRGRTTYSSGQSTQADTLYKKTTTPQFIANKPSSNDRISNEEDEFQKLITETSKAHKQKTLTLLNQLFDKEISNDQVILLIKNKSNCNLIIRIKGIENYILAVPAKGENFLTLNKGAYQLSSNMCNVSYSSNKNILENMLVTLDEILNYSVNKKLIVTKD